MSLSRRDWLSAAVALAISGCAARVVPNSRVPFFERNALPIGLQLYTLWDLVQKDFEGTLRSLAGFGYRNVELAGFHGRTAAEIRTALDTTGLRCSSAHIPARPWANEESLSGDLEKLTADLKHIGVQYVVVPNPLPLDGETPVEFTKRFSTHMAAGDWQRNAAFLNRTGEQLRKSGLQLAYHNHNQDFRPLANTTGLEILLTETDRDLVKFEMDVGWVAAAGLDPTQWLMAHPGRFHLMHVKDVKASTVPNFEGGMAPTEVGAGKVDWRRVLPAAHAAGVCHFFVEQEAPFERPRLEAVAKSCSFLRELEA